MIESTDRIQPPIHAWPEDSLKPDLKSRRRVEPADDSHNLRQHTFPVTKEGLILEPKQYLQSENDYYAAYRPSFQHNAEQTILFLHPDTESEDFERDNRGGRKRKIVSWPSSDGFPQQEITIDVDSTGSRQAKSAPNDSELILYLLEHTRRSEIEAELSSLFSLATYIDLEPGMDNAFSLGLEALIERCGEPALAEIRTIILEERTNASIAMEALQYIGRMDSNRWKTERRKLLEQCLLRSLSAWVRDGAGLGLASLDDPRSIRAVKTAIAKESSNMLKKDLESVLDQLEKTRSES